MVERNDLLGFFEFLISGEVARAVKEGGGVAASGPSLPVASRAIESYEPAVIRRLWAYIVGRPEDEAARILEALANLDDRTAQELAKEAGAAIPELADVPEAARKELAAVLATIPAALRERLPRDDRGRWICPAGALPRDESALLRMIPLPSPASAPLPTREPTGAHDDLGPITLVVPPPVGDPDGSLARGDRVGDNYEILGLLGGGGMGRVYRARHLRLDREVALKVIKGHCIDPEAIRRFGREMEILGRLDDPHLVRATDAGESPHGRLFLVMDLVSGSDLGRLVQARGPLPLADACELARQAALGLQAVHEKGLVHRDIKPSNLMLTPDGVVKVLDLGLARLVEDAADSLTQPGAFGGTADYLAPEQASDLRAATIRSDLYSLGCTLYCLLAGRPPFGDDRHRSLASKLLAHRAEPVAPITAVRPELAGSRELLRLLDRLLAKDPACRPAEPREVAEALGPLTADHDLPGLLDDRAGPRPPVVVPPPPPEPLWRRLRRLWRRLRRPAAAACAVLAIGLGVAALFFSASPLRIESLAVQHYTGDPARLRGTIGVLSQAARFNDNVRVKARLDAPAYCYLIALNPDGSTQPCPKSARHAPPGRTAAIVYPAEADDYYGLTDGTGLQAFVLVASRRPLPSFDSWPARAGLPWTAAAAGEAWRYDGHDFAPLGDSVRGTERRVPPAPAPFAATCRYLSRLPGVDAVQAIAFPVLPAEDVEPKASPTPTR